MARELLPSSHGQRLVAAQRGPPVAPQGVPEGHTQAQPVLGQERQKEGRGEEGRGAGRTE